MHVRLLYANKVQSVSHVRTFFTIGQPHHSSVQKLYRHEASSGLFATAELLVKFFTIEGKVNFQQYIYYCIILLEIYLSSYLLLPTIPSVSCRTTLRKFEVRVLAYLEENANENVTCINFCYEVLWVFCMFGMTVSDQTIIDNAINEWRGRLHACVQAKGRHFEQLL